jgi:hypothetical protein
VEGSGCGLFLRHYPGIPLFGLKKPERTSIRKVGAQPEIRLRHLLNVNHKRYRLSKPARSRIASLRVYSLTSSLFHFLRSACLLPSILYILLTGVLHFLCTFVYPLAPACQPRAVGLPLSCPYMPFRLPGRPTHHRLQHQIAKDLLFSQFKKLNLYMRNLELRTLRGVCYLYRREAKQREYYVI